MSIPSWMRSLLLSVLVALFSSCDRTEPPVPAVPPVAQNETPQPESDTISPDFTSIAPPAGRTWLRCSTVAGARNAKQIGEQGDTIQLGSHLLTVPPGAVSSPVDFVLQEPGNAFVNLQVTINPVTEFRTPVELRISYARCTTAVNRPEMFRTSASQVTPIADQTHDEAGRAVTARLTRFSNFALATN